MIEIAKTKDKRTRRSTIVIRGGIDVLKRRRARGKPVAWPGRCKYDSCLPVIVIVEKNYIL
jgi:hypothetical protein